MSINVADISTLVENGCLIKACQNGHFDCVRYLVESAKIDVNSLRKGDW